MTRGASRPMDVTEGRAESRAALRIVLAYAVLAGLWIAVSDHVAAWLFPAAADLLRASTLKGWLFVAVTSLLLYVLIRQLLDRIRAAADRELAAQQEKLQAMQLLAAIAENSSDAIFAKDTQGRYLLINRETARVIGKTAEQVLGGDDTALFPAQQAAAIRARDRRVLAENRIDTSEEALSTVDGERTYQSVKGPLRDADGKVIGIFGISRDITERRQAELAMRANIEELAQFNRLAVGRELDMIRLKQEVNDLSVRLGQAPPYAVAFAAAPMSPSSSPSSGTKAQKQTADK